MLVPLPSPQVQVEALSIRMAILRILMVRGQIGAGTEAWKHMGILVVDSKRRGATVMVQVESKFLAEDCSIGQPLKLSILGPIRLLPLQLLKALRLQLRPPLLYLWMLSTNVRLLRRWVPWLWNLESEKEVCLNYPLWIWVSPTPPMFQRKWTRATLPPSRQIRIRAGLINCLKAQRQLYLLLLHLNLLVTTQAKLSLPSCQLYLQVQLLRRGGTNLCLSSPVELRIVACLQELQLLLRIGTVWW